MSILYSEDTLKLLLSLVMGSLIGIEREYRSKAAGFRTITLISLGSTLFTIISIRLGGTASPDRVAANIITGIGFLGAGVVFKDGLNITALTTATSIWVTAALGMAIGTGDYILAAEGLVIVIIVLSVFEIIQGWIDNYHQKRSYKIQRSGDNNINSDIENTAIQLNLKFDKKKELKQDSDCIIYYDIYGSRKSIDKFNLYLLNLPAIKSFEC